MSLLETGKSRDLLDIANLGGFDIDSYLLQRDINPTFVMVEIGHGGTPAVIKQPLLEGQRAYIGVESWLRDGWNKKREKIGQILGSRASKNIFFISQELDGEVVYDEDDGTTWYSGNYDPQTMLPDGAANEVLLSNVFGDPHVANGVDSTERLLAEAARLIDDEGKIIVRETITPLTSRLNSVMIHQAGLFVDSVITPVDRAQWEKLEDVYAGEVIPVNNKDHYIILSKGYFN